MGECVGEDVRALQKYLLEGKTGFEKGVCQKSIEETKDCRVFYFVAVYSSVFN